MKSTILVRTLSLLFITGLVLGTGFFVAPPAQAGCCEGTIFVTNDGTVYLVENGQRRGFPSLPVFLSYGYKFRDIDEPNQYTESLPEGPIMIYADGTLVLANDGTVYIIANGEKRGFTTAEVFWGLGYSFTNLIIDVGDIASLIPDGPVIDSASISHPVGTLVLDNGTVYKIAPTGRKGISSLAVFSSYGFRFQKVVPANDLDRALPYEGTIDPRVINYAHRPSAPIIEGPATVTANQGASFSIVSTDADGDNLTYRVEWGDGTRNFETKVAGESVSIAHTWTRAGIYIMFVEVGDGLSNFSQNEFEVVVWSPLPRAQTSIEFSDPNPNVCCGQAALIGASNQPLGDFQVRVLSEPVQVTRLVLNVLGGKASSVKDVTIKDSSGRVVAGPFDPINNNLVSTDTIIFPIGISAYSIYGSLASNLTGSDTVQFRIDNPATTVVAKGTTSNSTVTASPTSPVTLRPPVLSQGSATVALAASSPVAQNVTVGKIDHAFLAIAVTASNAEDVRITRLNLAHRTSALNIQNNIANLKVVVDGVTQTPIVQPTAFSESPASTVFSFISPIVVSRGSSKTLVIRGDIVAGQNGQTHQFGCDGPSCITITGASTGNAIPALVSVGSGPLMTISTSGAFYLSLDAANPSNALVTGGSSKVTVMELSLKAASEAVDLRDIHFDSTSGNGGAVNDEFTAFYLFDGSTQVASVIPTTINSVTFLSIQSFRIPANTVKRLTVKADVANVGSAGTADSGQGISLSVAEGAYSAVGVTSGYTLSKSSRSGSATGSKFIAVKSVPTFQKLSLANTNLTNGSSIPLYKFKLTADAKGDIGFYKAAFDVQSSGASLSGYQLVEEPGTASESIVSYPTSPRDAIIGFARIIAAGTSKTYELRATVANSVSGSTVTTAMLGDTQMASPTPFFAVLNSTEKNFIWSDLSFGDVSSNSVNLSQWLNGYLVPGLPDRTDAQVLSRAGTTAPRVDLKVGSQDSPASSHTDGPMQISSGAAVTFSWTLSEQAWSLPCTLTDISSMPGLRSGTVTLGRITASKTYTLTCLLSGATYTDSVTVNVGSALLLDISLDASSPATQTFPAGSSNVAFSRLRFAATGGDITLSAITVSSDSANAPSLNNIRIYDGDSTIGSSSALYSLTVPGTSSPANTRYQEINLITPVRIASGTVKTLTIKADLSSSASGSLRLGIMSLPRTAEREVSALSTLQLPLYGNPVNVSPPPSQGTLSFSKDAFNFSYTQGGVVPETQQIIMTNNSNYNVDYTLKVSNQPSWYNTAYNPGTLTSYLGGTTTGIGAGVNPAGLAPGTYTTNLTITGNFVGSPKIVPITLIVSAPAPVTPSYRYLKVQSTSNSWVAWHEIVAYDSAGILLTPSSCSASGNYNSSCQDVYAGASGAWNAGSGSGYIILDYGSNKSITEVRLKPSNSPSPATATNEIFGMPDGGATYTSLKTSSGPVYDQQWLTYQLSSVQGIQIINQAPTAPTVSGPNVFGAGLAQNYYGYSLDPEGAPITYAINWGNGLRVSQSLGSGYPYQASHAWIAPGSYTITITATDSAGNSRVTTLGIQVQ